MHLGLIAKKYKGTHKDECFFMSFSGVFNLGLFRFCRLDRDQSHGFAMSSQVRPQDLKVSENLYRLVFHPMIYFSSLYAKKLTR